MIGSGHSYRVMTQSEEDALHRNVLRIVAEVGLQVENEALLDRLAAGDGHVDRHTRRVTFAEPFVEDFMASSPRYNWANHRSTVSGDASIFQGTYLDPRSDDFVPLSPERARDFYRVARAMPHTGSLGLLGCPFEDTPGGLEPLYEKYWAWRLGVAPGGAIHDIRLCPHIAEMYRVHADFAQQRPEEIFAGNVWLSPPLRLAYLEAEQVAWFLDRDLRVNVGTSLTMGGATGPVSLAGMVAVGLAECILLALLNRALYGTQEWGLFMSVTAMDARTAMRPYGRPDMALANLIAAQMARRYGLHFSGHCGLTDAMRPSEQAAAQKMQSALPTLMASGSALIPTGLLGVDQIFSPVQVVLDEQLSSALEQFARHFEVSDESIGFDTIRAAGPGGRFLTEPHTAEWLRREVWEPELWERRGFSAWRQEDGQTDVERARARVDEILEQTPQVDFMAEEEKTALDGIIGKARKALAG